MTNSEFASIACLLAGLAGTQPALAATTGQPDEEIVIWGTRVKSSSIFLDEEQIGVKQADHLSDLLRDIPGVDVGGTHSLNQRINIRGLDDTDLQVTIDGANQNNYMYHHMGNLLINADILRAVDVQVGANSVINGGMGGAVHFETKVADDLLSAGENYGARMQTAYHDNALWSYGLTGYARIGERLDAVMYYSQVDRDNFEDGDGVEVFGSDGDLENLLLKTGFAIDDRQRLALSYDRYRDSGSYAERPDMGVRTNQALSAGLLFPTEYGRDTLTAAYTLDLGSGLNLRLSGFRNETDLERLATLTNNRTEGNAANQGVSLLAESRIDFAGFAHRLLYGFDYLHQETDYRLKYGNGSPDRTDLQQAENLAFYAEDRIGIGERFSLKPGIRVDRYAMDTDINDSDYTRWSFGLAGEFVMTDQLRLQGGRTEFFKGPELSEVFTGAGIGNIPNPDLEPESGHNDELGLRFRTTNMLGIDSINANFTVFRTRLEDKIEEVDYPLDACTGRGCAGWYDNTGAVEIQGLEAGLSVFKNNLSATASYSKSDSEVKSTGFPLEREVGDSIGLSLDYTFPSLHLDLNWTSRFALDETASAAAKQGYDLHNISGRWQPDSIRGLSVTLGVENLFDELYVSHASRVGVTIHPVFGPLVLDDYEPGRNIKATLSYKFN
jgi:hemoglobin/transferrin/lactoferrin receptor protein